MKKNNPVCGHDNCPYCGADVEVKLSMEGRGAGYYYCPEGCGKWSFSKQKTRELFIKPTEPKSNYDSEQSEPATSYEPTATTSDQPAGIIQPAARRERISTAFD